MKTMEKALKKIGKGLATALFPALLMGCSKNFEGELVAESFYPDPGWGVAKYTALIKTENGKIITVQHTGDHAYGLDLEYNVGDNVIGEEVNSLFETKYYIRDKKSK